MRLMQEISRVKFYNTVIDDEPMSYFTYLKKQISNIPLSHFTKPRSFADFILNHISTVTTDRIVVSILQLTYPSKFNFNNQTNFYFELPATATGNYLVIDNFNYGSTSPVLLDLTSNKRYIGDITSTPGKVQFVLPPSSATLRKFELVSEDAFQYKYSYFF